MTTIDTGAAARRPALPVASGLARMVARLSGAWADYALRRETYRKLSNLTDRELDDIGLTRADVDAMR